MKFYFNNGAPKKNYYTIGYFDDDEYNDNYGKIFTGVIDAARKHDACIIRFGYHNPFIGKDVNQLIDISLQHILQYKLDGLLFLGWPSAAYYYKRDTFTRYFQSIPVFSIGTNFPNIPSNFFSGDQYLQQLIKHLIEEHKLKKTAYIAPYRPDKRSQTYIETMTQYGLWDEELYVEEELLDGLDFKARGRRALEILLDERKIQIDSLISLYNHETEGIIEELIERGIKIPEDIAVTTYGDGDKARFASPALTTIYYPWMELGYYGCEKMIELLDKGHIPLETEVPGKIIFRESCGCIPNTVVNAKAGRLEPAEKMINELSQNEQKEIIAKLEEAFPHIVINFQSLLEALIKDFVEGKKIYFYETLLDQLNNIPYPYENSNVEDLVSFMRKLLLPYFKTKKETLIWAGDIFQQAQVGLWEKIITIKGNKEVQAKIVNQNLQEISQQLIANFNIPNIMNTLEINLTKLNIPSCYIIIFNSVFEKEETVNNLDNIYESSNILFKYCDHQRIETDSTISLPASQILAEILLPDSLKRSLFAHLLYVQNDFIGIILFEPGPMDGNIYEELSVHISTALKGALILEQLELSYKKLVEQAHREGISDIATAILHNVGNVLNSAKVSIHVLKEIIQAFPIDDFFMANQLLERNIDNLGEFIIDNPKGKKLIELYIKLSDYFNNIQSQINYHGKRLNEKMNSIADIINAQQSYAGIESNTEEILITEIIDDVLKVQANSLEQLKIEIIREYHALPRITAQRVKLFHILYNLIDNAKEAIILSAENERKLLFLVEEDRNGKFIRITDSGAGIPPDSFERLFSYGYTTKKGRSGFGLFSCGVYMKELGGKIWVESKGNKKGATFILQFM